MSNCYEGDVVCEDEKGNFIADQYIVLKDGRASIAHDGVDHRASPSETAKVIRKLERKVKKGYELVEVVCGDDCLWWAVVPTREAIVRFTVEINELMPLSDREKRKIAKNLQNALHEMAIHGFDPGNGDGTPLNSKLGVSVKVSVVQ